MMYDVALDSRPMIQSILMGTAQAFAMRSTCSRAQVGAVIARDGRIISTGYNGAPAGMPHCDHSGDGAYRQKQPCQKAVHAEVNAIAWAARVGSATDGAEMYCTHAPCATCAKLIVNAGIATVYFGQDYRNDEGLHLLRDAGVQLMFWPTT